MRTIKYIVMHCTATAVTATVESILSYWRKTLGWKNPGYHFLIKRSGEVVGLLPIEKIANGVAGFNANSIHVSYIGGIDGKDKAIDNRTPEQIASQVKLVKQLKQLFPDAEVKGHRDFPNVKKECPSFDVASWLKELE